MQIIHLQGNRKRGWLLDNLVIFASYRVRHRIRQPHEPQIDVVLELRYQGNDDLCVIEMRPWVKESTLQGDVTNVAHLSNAAT